MLGGERFKPWLLRHPCPARFEPKLSTERLVERLRKASDFGHPYHSNQRDIAVLHRSVSDVASRQVHLTNQGHWPAWAELDSLL